MTGKKTKTRAKTQSTTRKKTRDALALIDRDVGDDPNFRDSVEEAMLNMDVAQMIYDERTAALLTQQKLADLVGTTQPVIARLEDADYKGHSLTMLRRIGKALNKTIELRFASNRAPGTVPRTAPRTRRSPRKPR